MLYLVHVAQNKYKPNILVYLVQEKTISLMKWFFCNGFPGVLNFTIFGYKFSSLITYI